MSAIRFNGHHRTRSSCFAYFFNLIYSIQVDSLHQLHSLSSSIDDFILLLIMIIILLLSIFSTKNEKYYVFLSIILF